MNNPKSQSNTSTNGTLTATLEAIFTKYGIRYESPEESKKDWERIFKEDKEKRQKAKAAK